MGPGDSRARPRTRPRDGAARRFATGLAACAGLLMAACTNTSSGAPASSGPARAATGTASPVPSPARGAGDLALARQYLAIAVAGNHHLERDFDGLRRVDHINLASARAYLRDAAATERLFDRRLLSMSLPPSVEVVARLLVSANESRARLAEEAATSASLAQLRADEAALTAANAPVEDAVRVIRSMLGLPPPQTS